MKDYTLNDEESKKFILNYDIRGNEIIINYANGSISSVTNNYHNRKYIENLMEQQISNKSTKKFKKSKTRSFYLQFILLYINAILFVGSSVLMFATQLYIPFSIVIIMEMVCSCLSISEIVKLNEVIRDVDKNLMFVENKDLINEEISKDEKILESFEKETIKTLSSIEEDKKLDINKIDKVSYVELKNMLESIKNPQAQPDTVFIKNFKNKKS